MTTTLTVLTTEIRLLDGLYSLNDLHRAAGSDKAQQPANFLRLDQTQALIAELNSSDVRITPTRVIKGNRADGLPQGTYVCRELVYAYAMWISPKFNLAVIRAFDALATQPPAADLPRLLATTRVLLSFDAQGHARTTHVPHDAYLLTLDEFMQLLASKGLAIVPREAAEAIAKAIRSTQP